MYNKGKLSQDQLPRIVDDGYPSIVVGVVNETRGMQGGFSGYLNLKTGEKVLENEIDSLLTYQETLDKYSDYIDSSLDAEKMQASIEAYNEDAKVFWETAVANKGHIADFAVRGTAKNQITELTDEMKRYWDCYKRWGYYERNAIENYDACGAVAEGFVLDYLYANGLIDNKWNNLSYSEKKKILYDKLDIFSFYIANVKMGEVTLPHKLGSAIGLYGNYKASLSACICPERAIDSGLPGISLRIFGKGFSHYRPVIGYKKPGWWIFKWWQIKILDLVDCTNPRNGSWETYIPIYHFSTYNVLKK